MENKGFIEIDIEKNAVKTNLTAFKNIYRVGQRNNARNWVKGVFLVIFIVMFLPWTQNIRSKGIITTLRQEERPQELNTIIAGRVLKWMVKEGDYVQEGDTILQLGEVKVDYFDPKLLQRTREQIDAKKMSIDGYRNKAITAQNQVVALNQARDLKLQSLDNKIQQQLLKVQSDSMDVLAVNNEFTVAKRQIEAAKVMLDSGAISLVDFERRKISFQNAQAKRIGSENKYLQSKQELLNLKIEKNSAVQEYTDKIAKADGDRFSSLSNIASTEAEVSKMENIFANYDARNQFYFIRAPQSGQITKARKAGIGEVLKEGEMIVEIVPTKHQLAVEMFVDPMDLPLISIGQKVRFIFDGFPVIVFSGWPQYSYGTFGGKVVAIETSVSVNGKFRVLVSEDPDDKKWPEQLRLGGGANGIALLKDVRVYYELWRNINGFPPEYYKADAAKAEAKTAKKDK